MILYQTPLKEYEDPKIELGSPVKNSLRKKAISKDFRKQNRVKTMLNPEFLKEINKSNRNFNDLSKEHDAIRKFTK